MTDNKKVLDSFFKTYSDLDDKLDFKLASDPLTKEFDVISTGSYLLDDALHIGGICQGRLIQLYGRGGSGKTLMSMLLIKNAQKKDPEAMQCFIDAEGTFSTEWAEKLGIDTSRVILIEDDTAVNGRKLFTMLLGKNKEDKQHVLTGKSKEGLLDKVIKKEININLFVLDSLGAIIPPIEDVADVGRSNMSTMARFLTTTLKRVALEVKKANVAFVIINHARDELNMYSSSDHTFSGGNSYNHSLSANIWFEAIQRKDAQILDEKEEKIGHLIRAKVEKSKFGPHPKTCEFAVDFSKGVINLHEEVATLAIKYDVVQRPSNVTYVYGEQSYRGEASFQKALLDDTLREEILAKVEQAREAKKLNKKVEQIPDDADIDDVEEDLENILTTAKKRGRKAKEDGQS